ncbi:hypothetical protein [Kineococcus rhizosphaerae]|uniref:Uncharacterized protein n=1 Tax=Kineococcus rhizosphaerae TaxID=559628 RepID=A0A2T0R361_9ACTN|nr:hypothetical protein [Kineococcus rhizosphaerae]PRY14450.1 hypothetical protein CLV37_1068 [Kineococcus rhizosphaerae]
MTMMPLSQPLAEQAPGRSDLTVDVRDRPLQALHEAYEERWRLVAAASVEHPADDELTRSALEINDLERQCRPLPRVPRRVGPDPSTFLG